MDQPTRKRPSLREMLKRPKKSGFNLDGTIDPAVLEAHVRAKENMLKPEDIVVKDAPSQRAERIVLETGVAYATKIKKKAEKHAIEVILGKEKPVTYKAIEPSELLELPDADEIGAGEPAPQESLQPARAGPLCDSRIKSDRTVSALPVSALKSEIVDSIRSNRVTIIEGSTGCGKTTQVPMYIYEDMMKRGQRCNIVVTQPRRIAAVSVSRHVARLLNSELGDTVGFQIGFSRKHSGRKTSILYCTIGVLLQKIVFARSLSYFSHVVIDEVHERDIDTDLLLMVVRKLLWEQNSTIKVVLMSASFQTEHFSEYFQISMQDPRYTNLTTPVVHRIAGKPQDLKTFYLDEVQVSASNAGIHIQMPSESEFQLKEPHVLPALYNVCCALIDWLDAQDEDSASLSAGAILIFLPGLFEIDQLHSQMLEFDQCHRYHILKVHSCLEDSRQQLIFEKAPEGKRKVILSTNIAESSITVPDISHVIDFCLTKQLVMDEVTGLPTLQMQWVSKANALQRAGRAGRVSAGRAWRMVYNSFFTNFRAHPTPEICRCPLEQAVLKVKALSLGPPKELLASCLDPPPLEHIRSAVLKLKRLGALTVALEQSNHPDLDGEMTALGKIMNALPIDVSLSKLIAMGFAVGLLDDCVNIAASLTVDDVFNIQRDALDVYKTRFDLSKRSFCDLLTIRNIISKYLFFTQTLGELPKGLTIEREGQKWASFYNLSYRRLKEITTLRDEILLRLERVGMKQDYDPDECSYLSPSDQESLLKCIFAGAFYPNYFIRGSMDQDLIEKNEMDPFSMVSLGNLPKESLLYAPQITEFFAPICKPSNLSVTFMYSRAFVSFPRFDSITLHETDLSNIEEIISRRRENDFPRSIYLALMLKRIRSDRLTIRACPQEEILIKKIKEVKEFLKKDDLNKVTLVFSQTLTIAPHLTVEMTARKITVVVSHVEKCGNFWVRLSPQDTNQLISIRDTLSALQLTNLSVRSIYPSIPCIFEEDLHGITYRSRAVVLASSNLTLDQTPNANANRIFIRLVDSGKTLWTNLSSLFQMPVDIPDQPKFKTEFSNGNGHPDPRQQLLIPALALECKLVNLVCINPSNSRYSEANKYFEKFMNDLKAQDPDIQLEIYSHVNGVARVSINTPKSLGLYGENLTEHLVKLGYAEFSQETINSNIDHMKRERFRSITSTSEIMLEGIKIAVQPKAGTSLENDLKPICVNSASFLWGRGTRDFREGNILNAHGPSNPLETTFYGLCSSYKWSAAQLDRRSINCIVLEPDITQAKTRMMVAPVCIMRNNKISAVKTSLMPYIRGFAPLMQMLFAPKVSLRFDIETNCYTGALSGLGTEPISQSNPSAAPLHLDEEFDMQMDFDTYFTSLDILKIQTIRYLFSDLLQNTSHVRDRVAGQVVDCRVSRERLRTCILSLINKNRFPLPKRKNRHDSTQNGWKALEPSELKGDVMKFGSLMKPFLAPIPEPAKVNPTLSSIKNTFEQLKKSASTAGEYSAVRCPICGEIVGHQNFSEHETSEEHRVQQLLFDCHYDQEIEDEEAEEQWKLRQATAALDASFESGEEMSVE